MDGDIDAQRTDWPCSWRQTHSFRRRHGNDQDLRRSHSALIYSLVVVSSRSGTIRPAPYERRMNATGRHAMFAQLWPVTRLTSTKRPRMSVATMFAPLRGVRSADVVVVQNTAQGE